MMNDMTNSIIYPILVNWPNIMCCQTEFPKTRLRTKMASVVYELIHSLSLELFSLLLKLIKD